MIKAAIFDLDGTLLDTLTDLYESVNYSLAQVSLPLRTFNEVRSFVGNGLRNLISRAVGERQEKADDVLKIFLPHYEKNKENNTKPYDGVIALLEGVKNAGLKTAVVSNKRDSAVIALCERFFPSLIDFAIGDRDGIAIKPAPDMVNIALRKLGVKRSDCVYAGDSEVDLQTARNSRMPCISVTWGFKDKDFLVSHGAKVLAGTPQEVLRIILNI